MENTDVQEMRVSFLALPDGTQADITDVLLRQGRPAFLIGTDSRSHLRLNDAAAAPSHAVISLRDGMVVVKPVTPLMEVRVNNRKLSAPTPLYPGDVVQIGETVLTFDQGDAEASWTPAALPAPANDTPQNTAALAAAAQAEMSEAVNVYFPPSARQTATRSSSSGIVPVMAAFAAVAGILTFFGLNLVSGAASLPGAPAGVEQQFAYHDGNVTLVMFEADWCTYCKQQKPIITALSEEYRGDMYVSYVDIDNPVNRGFANRYEASSIPLIVIFNDEGKAVTFFRGVTSDRTLRLAIERALLTSTGSSVIPE